MRLKTLIVLLVLTWVGTEGQFYLLVVPYTQRWKSMEKYYNTKYFKTSKLQSLKINKTKVRLGQSYIKKPWYLTIALLRNKKPNYMYDMDVILLRNENVCYAQWSFPGKVNVNNNRTISIHVSHVD